MHTLCLIPRSATGSQYAYLAQHKIQTLGVLQFSSYGELAVLTGIGCDNVNMFIMLSWYSYDLLRVCTSY